MPRSYTRVPLREKMERHIVRPDGIRGCWVWTGGLRTGYGVINTGYKAEGTHRPQLAHRVMYEMLVGPIPAGLDLDHLCRVRACCNPDHLEPVTRRENLLRGIGLTAQKAAQTHCIHGHEFTDFNTYRRPNGTRACRTCMRERQRVNR